MKLCFGVLGLVGAAVSAVGSIASGVAQSEMASYQAEIANQNAKLAEQSAKRAMAAGQAQTEQESLKNAATAGAIKTGLAANNVDVNTGSSADVLASQRELGSLDSSNVLYNAALQGYGYRTQSYNFKAQAGLYQAQSDAAIPGALIGAAGGLLGSVSSLGLKGGFSGFGLGSSTFSPVSSGSGYSTGANFLGGIY